MFAPLLLFVQMLQSFEGIKINELLKVCVKRVQPEFFVKKLH
jgi:hypothetical protein